MKGLTRPEGIMILMVFHGYASQLAKLPVETTAKPWKP
jgi:hypothetical protein